MITIINFSSRLNGNCKRISDFIETKYPSTLVKKYDFFKLQLSSCGLCNYECLKNEVCYKGFEVKELYDDILNSELVYYVIPNYSDYPCANYFIFNERGTAYFSSDELLEKFLNVKKKFIVVSTSNNKTFKEVFEYQTIEEPNILFINPSKFNQKSIEGNLINNKSVRKLITAFVLEKYVYEKSAMAIVFYKNKILTTVENVYDTYVLSLPKGHIEKDEDIIEASIRECYEETNIVITKDDYFGEVEPFNVKFINHHNNIVIKTIYPVIFSINSFGKPKIKENRIKKIKYIKVQDFIMSCTYQNVKEIVTTAYRRYKGVKDENKTDI